MRQIQKELASAVRGGNMFINFWYFAEESKNVSEEPVYVRMLGQDFCSVS